MTPDPAAQSSAAPGPAAPDSAAWTSAVDACLTETLDSTRAALAPALVAGDEIMDSLSVSAAGGKRLRAHLLLAAHAASAGEHHDAAVAIAAAVELFQTAALIHDDVIDGSATRRGLPSAHLRLSSLHAERGWGGDGDAFGTSGAVLAGDVALMACYRALHRGMGGLSPAGSGIVASLMSDMAQLVTAGQYLDLRLAAAPLDELDGQLPLIEAAMRSKTASYSAEFPFALGAAAAERPADAVAQWRALGVPIGIAFQIRDDVLGLVGSPATTGKPVGDDLREGKRTVIVHHAWRHGGDDARAAIAAVLGEPGADEGRIADAIEAIAATGALDHAERRIADLTGQGLELLHQQVVPGAARDHLERLIEASTQRHA